MTAREWRPRHLVGLFISGGGLAVLIGRAVSQWLG